jgi:hypothetical protein
MPRRIQSMVDERQWLLGWSETEREDAGIDPEPRCRERMGSCRLLFGDRESMVSDETHEESTLLRMIEKKNGLYTHLTFK